MGSDGMVIDLIGVSQTWELQHKEDEDLVWGGGIVSRYTPLTLVW